MKPNHHIRIGTRGSLLALWQANHVASLLQQHGATTELVLIETKGDKVLDRSFAKIGSKGVFTEELEEQLLSGGIHIAVHSAKDMQSSLPAPLELIAFTEREQTHDVLVSDKPSFEFKDDPNLRIGTSSVRRTAFLRLYYPNIGIVPVRGNLQTRMRKLQEGACDALMLAFAGVHRMQMAQHIVHHFPIGHFVPPVGQGSVAVEASSTLSADLREFIRKAVNHLPTETCLLAERAFLRTVDGGCSIPSFAHATLEGNNLKLVGGLVSPDGKECLRFEHKGTAQAPEALGAKLGNDVLQNGGKQILEGIRSGAYTA